MSKAFSGLFYFYIVRMVILIEKVNKMFDVMLDCIEEVKVLLERTSK